MRIFNCIFVFLFMTMLAFPLIFVDLSSNRVSVQENRMLAERPKLENIKKSPGRFIRDFNAWFEDSTGFRVHLLGVYEKIIRSKWLNSVVDFSEGEYLYLMGKHGHHYFADINGSLIPKFQGKEFLSNEQLFDLAAKLEEIKLYLDNKEIPSVLMFCTDKESIYPEFYPKSIKRGPEPNQLEIITRYLLDHTNMDIFNIRQALLNQKDAYLLYPVSRPDDVTHYTQIAAFFAYRELMKYINIHFPMIVPYEIDDIEINFDEKDISHVKVKTRSSYKRLDASFFDGVNLHRPFTGENHAYENRNPDLPTILFLCDSYASEQFIGKYIAQHFGKSIFIHFINTGHFEDYVNRFKPDIVVFQAVERTLKAFAYWTSELHIE